MTWILRPGKRSNADMVPANPADRQRQRYTATNPFPFLGIDHLSSAMAECRVARVEVNDDDSALVNILKRR